MSDYCNSETGLYYLNARYYSPEWRRFISPDNTSYLDPDSVNGLNLYCYCNNDPVNYADPSGNDPKWWQWALGGIGVALVATAAAMAFIGTGGVAAFGIGALIGSIALGGIGAVAGGVIGYATGGVDGILGGAMAGFGIGAIVGFAVGGSIGYSYHISQCMLNSYNMPNSKFFDCSEVADDLFRMAQGKGKILKITPKNATYFNVYSIGDDFIYHTVYSRGLFILDPVYSSSPVLAFAYIHALHALNPGINLLINGG